jgi:simple sugar transport system ATP-binding protein
VTRNPPATDNRTSPRPVLEAVGLTKSYGRVQALRGANFTAYPNEVVAVVGDNGAGKSTLIKIISGVIPSDEGEVRLDGRTVTHRTPEALRRLGLETVYQDLALAPALDSSVNLFLGRERLRPGWLGRLGILDNKAMRRETEDAFARLSVGVQDTSVPVASLSGGQRQSVAVARAVTWASRVILLDEPAAALGVVQTSRVSDLIRTVRDGGATVVLISHDLPFVFETADRIEVLRLGKRVARLDVRDTTPVDVLGAMTGAVEQVDP